MDESGRHCSCSPGPPGPPGPPGNQEKITRLIDHLTTYFRPQREKGAYANNSERWTKGADRKGETIEETVCAAKPRYGLLYGKTKPQE